MVLAPDEAGESGVLRSRCWAGFGLSKGLGSGGAAEWFWGEESVTLLLGFLLAVLSDPTFLQSRLSSGSCPAEPSHVSVHGRVLT